MTTDLDQLDLHKMRGQAHANCIVCAATRRDGLGLQFDVLENGSVEAVFACDPAFEGYQGMLHGGVAASLVDGAMTNCLFAHGIPAVTAELKVRFRHPLKLAKPAQIRAWVDRSSQPLYLMKAEIFQEEQKRVTATGKFMAQPHLAAPDSNREPPR